MHQVSLLQMSAQSHSQLSFPSSSCSKHNTLVSNHMHTLLYEMYSEKIEVDSNKLSGVSLKLLFDRSL